MDKEKEVINIKVPKFTKKFRENPWIISTFVLVVLAIVLVINGSGNGGITGYAISEDDAGDYLINYLSSGGYEGFEVQGINEIGDLYKINTLYEGEEIPFYITKDGYFVGNQLISIISDEPSPPEGYSEEDIEKISVFIDCLAEEGVIIYGANWCGWTKKLVVETLGGFDIAAPIYVECTENEELCAQEGIEGYPTIKINGVLYTGERTFEGLSEVTGCSAPEVAVQSNPGQEASC